MQSFEPAIKRAARLHQRPDQGFHFDVMVATMGSILFEENINTFRYYLGEIAANIPYLNRAHPYDPSTGVAQMRPTTAMDIMNGVIRNIDNSPLAQVPCHYLPSLNNLSAQIYLRRASQEGLDINSYSDRREVWAILQDPEVAIELLAVTIADAVERAVQLKITPSIFNAATYHNQGQQHVSGLDLKLAPYGQSILRRLNKAADVLSVGHPIAAIRSNAAERKDYPVEANNFVSSGGPR